ncbi:hypothetical protein DSL72_001323 [Monilinia vaccinii-corymbosi]|uniref:Uncharacterized protein n=1 Tax=Monilinia vaccinii-corymbosi TaxID=61207 RepID=A0A8A3P1I6_9HELO|nr:hypothetical protein DSL72_001323 [Monilinia vaccinii-corymbosi]
MITSQEVEASEWGMNPGWSGATDDGAGSLWRDFGGGRSRIGRTEDFDHLVICLHPTLDIRSARSASRTNAALPPTRTYARSKFDFPPELSHVHGSPSYSSYIN